METRVASCFVPLRPATTTKKVPRPKKYPMTTICHVIFNSLGLFSEVSPGFIRTCRALGTLRNLSRCLPYPTSIWFVTGKSQTRIADRLHSAIPVCDSPEIDLVCTRRTDTCTMAQCRPHGHTEKATLRPVSETPWWAIRACPGDCEWLQLRTNRQRLLDMWIRTMFGMAEMLPSLC